MMQDMTELVSQARQGDAEAFGCLYKMVYQDLFRYAVYCLGSTEEAEDAVQETALEAFRGIARLKKAESFRGWIFTILYARCNRHIARLIVRRNESDIDTCVTPSDDFAQNQDLSIRLREAVGRLPAEDRRLVMLSVVGGFSGHEIAALLKRPEGTLRSRLHRTLKKLRALLDENDEFRRN